MYLQGAVWRKNSQKIIRFLNTLPPLKGKGLVVAFSGGADSLFLLVVLKELQKKYHYDLYPVHINHLLLKEDPLYADLAVLAANKLGLDCTVVEANVKAQRGNLEELMRETRYQILEEERRKKQADFILTAHHAKDQAETVLGNMVRGCGLRGLQGIPAQNGFILRPLLEVKKEAIVEMLSQTRLPYYEDKLNYVSTGKRNKIRKNILPILEENLATSLEDNFLNLSKNIRDLNLFIEEEREKYLALIDFQKFLTEETIVFSKNSFSKLNIFWKRELIRFFLNDLAGENFKRSDILKIEKWIKEGQRKELHFKKTLWQRKENKKIAMIFKSEKI